MCRVCPKGWPARRLATGRLVPHDQGREPVRASRAPSPGGTMNTRTIAIAAFVIAIIILLFLVL